MNKIEELQTIFANMLKIAPQDLGPETSLEVLNTSLGGARIRLALKRLDLALPAGANPKTFGALQATLSTEASSSMPDGLASASKIAYKPASNGMGTIGLGTLGVGLDIENIHSLPEAKDYWEHEFYRGSFAKSEIAYAVLQQEPRISFAGFWCAKEALRKCDGSFRTVDPPLTAVAHDADGRPYLTLLTDNEILKLPHAVSISHTHAMAMAVVATAAMPASVAAAENSHTDEDNDGSAIPEAAHPATSTSTHNHKRTWKSALLARLGFRG